MVEVAREGLFILRLKQRYQSPSYPLKKITEKCRHSSAVAF